MCVCAWLPKYRQTSRMARPSLCCSEVAMFHDESIDGSTAITVFAALFPPGALSRLRAPTSCPTESRSRRVGYSPPFFPMNKAGVTTMSIRPRGKWPMELSVGCLINAICGKAQIIV